MPVTSELRMMIIHIIIIIVITLLELIIYTITCRRQSIISGGKIAAADPSGRAV